MKKVVVRLDIHEKKDGKKALKAVSPVSGIDSISVNMNDKELTVIGDVDPIEVVLKLRKKWHVELISVGPEKKNITNTITNEAEQEYIRFYNAYGYMRQPQP